MQVAGQVGQPVEARPALAGRLPGQVVGDLGGVPERAGARVEHVQDAGADRCAVGGQGGPGHPDVEVGRRHPRAVVAADQDGDGVDRLRPGEDVAQRGAALGLDDAGVRGPSR